MERNPALILANGATSRYIFHYPKPDGFRGFSSQRQMANRNHKCVYSTAYRIQGYYVLLYAEDTMKPG